METPRRWLSGPLRKVTEKSLKVHDGASLESPHYGPPTCIRMVGDGGVKTAHVFLFSSAQGIRTELNSVPVEISRPFPQVSSFVGPLSCWFRTPPSPCMQTFQWFGTELALALTELSASWNWGKACGHQTSSQNQFGLVQIGSLCPDTQSISNLILSGNLLGTKI